MSVLHRDPQDASAPVVNAKAAMRRTASARRDALPETIRREAATAIARKGLSIAAFPSGSVVSAYSAMGSELDPGLLLERLSRAGHPTALPILTPRGNPLTFRAWSPGEPLHRRKWGILEPADDAPVVEPDVLFVPLLAFDREGYRLGYGGGYYDRTLNRLRALKPVRAIGVAFTAQEVDRVPRDDFDQRLDFILTPDFTLTFR